MNKQKTIYILQQESDSIDDIEAIFDDLEKVKDYNNRYQTESSFEIITHILNPAYEIDKTKDPYQVQLSRNHIEHASISRCYTHEDIVDAKAEKWSIHNYSDGPLKPPMFNVYLFAGSEEEALNRAVEIRDTQVPHKEWQETAEAEKRRKARRLQCQKYSSPREIILKKGLIASISVISLLILYIVFT